MKKRIAIILLLGGLAAGGLCVWNPFVSEAPENQPQPSVLRAWYWTISERRSRSTLSEPTFAEFMEQQQREREADVERGKEEWRTAIAFYGKVVDENGNPVSDAKIHFGTTDLSPSGNSSYQRTSAANGLFSISGIRGKLLTVKATKEGYSSSKRDNDSFYYAGQNVNFAPDSNSPVIFHLRKKGLAEPLTHVEFPGFAKYFQLKGNSEPIEFDLINGKPVPLGQGHIRFVFAAGERGRTIKRFDWKLTLSVPNGGLKATDDEFPYLAPEDGYEESHEIDMPQSSGNWRSEIQTQYFLKLSNGAYGRISFRLLADNGVFRLNSFINPTGSRNLEFDPEVQPKQTHFE